VKYVAGVYIGLGLNSFANFTISADTMGFLLEFVALAGTSLAQPKHKAHNDVPSIRINPVT
jgi:hypothetical protein